MFSDIFTLVYLCTGEKNETWHDTSNLASQRYTGSLLKKATKSVAYKIVIITEINGYPLCSLMLKGKSIKLAWQRAFCKP